MTMLSAKLAKTPRELAHSLLARFDALSRAHKIVMPGIMGSEVKGERTPLIDLIKTILRPYMEVNSGSERLIVRGPELDIDSNAVMSLALFLHESATNSAKYGALSRDTGLVHIGWITPGDELQLVWEETGGPAIVIPPKSTGFGSTLAKRSITDQLGGTIAFDWIPQGLKLTIKIPLKRLGL
jgi:two-component sensor histidine kinase